MRAAVTHFDGDPIVLDFWLLLYQKYWRGEVSKIYADVCYDPGLVGDSILSRVTQSLKRFPEIETEFVSEVHPPEWSNPRLIKKVTEETLFLIESDGWVFGRGVVDKYCQEIEKGKFDLVAANYRLFPESCDATLGYIGFMRNFFFCRTNYLKSVELDFYPRLHNGLNFDCFGYISYQLALKKPRVLAVPTNFVIDPQTNDLITYPWLHIRQMNSSILGFGSAGNGIFKGFMEGDDSKIQAVRKEVVGSPAAEWQYYKACAMRILMLYALRDYSPFATNYMATVKRVISELNLSWDNVQGLVTYYRILMSV